MRLAMKECLETKAIKMSDTIMEEMSGDMSFPWVMKEADSTDKFGMEWEVKLTALSENGYMIFNKNFGQKVKRDCWVVEYTFNSRGTCDFFDNIDEAMDFTMKLIALGRE